MFRKASSPMINQLSCRDWKIEAIIRFLLSNPAWRKNTDEINEIRILTDLLRQLESDQTLFIQSGEPVAVVRTSPSSPMLISSEAIDSGRYMERNALEQSLPNFYAFLEVQGMIQYFSEKMDSLIKTFFHGKLGGKLTLSTGLNEMAMIPPLIVTKNGGVCITIEPNSYQIQDGLKNNYYDIHVPTVNDAISLAEKALGEETPLSIVLLGNSKEVYQEFIARNVTPEIVIDQTKFQPTDSAKVIENYKGTLGIFEEKGSLFFDLSGSIGFREAGAWTNHIFPSPLSNVMFQQKSQERMPLQWIALSGKPDDIYKIDEAVLKEFKNNKKMAGWLSFIQERLYFDGLPSRTCWLTYQERMDMCDLLNYTVASGQLDIPIMIKIDHIYESPAINFRAGGDENSQDISLKKFSGAAMAGLEHYHSAGMFNKIHARVFALADGNMETFKELKGLLAMDSEWQEAENLLWNRNSFNL